MVPTPDNLLTSNLFYSRTTIVRKEKFEFEGILIIISILFLFLIGVRSGFFWPLASPFLANFFCEQKLEALRVVFRY